MKSVKTSLGLGTEMPDEWPGYEQATAWYDQVWRECGPKPENTAKECCQYRPKISARMYETGCEIIHVASDLTPSLISFSIPTSDDDFYWRYEVAGIWHPFQPGEVKDANPPRWNSSNCSPYQQRRGRIRNHGDLGNQMESTVDFLLAPTSMHHEKETSANLRCRAGNSPSPLPQAPTCRPVQQTFALIIESRRLPPSKDSYSRSAYSFCSLGSNSVDQFWAGFWSGFQAYDPTHSHPAAHQDIGNAASATATHLSSTSIRPRVRSPRPLRVESVAQWRLCIRGSCPIRSPKPTYSAPKSTWGLGRVVWSPARSGIRLLQIESLYLMLERLC